MASQTETELRFTHPGTSEAAIGFPSAHFPEIAGSTSDEDFNAPLNLQGTHGVLATAVIGGTASGATTDAGYRIDGGDLLHISVYGEENLNQDVAVQPDGWIAFPLVGNVDARGLTLKELQTKIATHLRASQYFPNLTDNEVTVAMVKATGNSISVVGQVK